MIQAREPKSGAIIGYHMTTPDDHERGLTMATAILHGITVAIPISIVLLAGFLMAFGGRNLGQAAATAILPGILIGVFFGGFVGVTRNM